MPQYTKDQWMFLGGVAAVVFTGLASLAGVAGVLVTLLGR